MDRRNLPKSEMWPRDDDFERVLSYMRVPLSDARHVIRVMRSFEPYLLRIGFESDMDFLYLLNSITTNIVRTAPDAREKRADQMIRALCVEEGLVYGLDDSEDESSDLCEFPESVVLPPTLTRHPDCDPTMCSSNAPCDLCQSTGSDASELSDTDQLCEFLESTADTIPVEEVHDSTEVELVQDEVENLCLAFERVNIPTVEKGCVHAITLSPSARRRLRKRRQKEFFEKSSPSAFRCDHNKIKRSPPKNYNDAQNLLSYPFYTFVSNMADVDWLRFRGVSDKIRLLTERLKIVDQS